ncbi:MAG: C1 family peptidase [Candidatus Bipolaricaulota bacterium]
MTHISRPAPLARSLAGTGWLPPFPDLRDYTLGRPELASLVANLGLSDGRPDPELPSHVDLRDGCSPVEDQGVLGSCTAHAAASVVEYFQRRAFGRHIEGSRRFIYKATRNLMGVSGDTGAWLRTTMAALVLCGVPAESYWPYTDADPDFDVEPPSFVYAVADDYAAVRYYCHDPLGSETSGDAVLAQIRRHLAAGVPAILGFWGFPSFEASEARGDIPFPCPREQAAWGHAVAAFGYDDARRITNTACGRSTTGALLIQNSWGREWGDAGYGWLPYRYVEARLARDTWSLLQAKWVDSGEFGI